MRLLICAEANPLQRYGRWRALDAARERGHAEAAKPLLEMRLAIRKWQVVQYFGAQCILPHIPHLWHVACGLCVDCVRTLPEEGMVSGCTAACVSGGGAAADALCVAV